MIGTYSEAKTIAEWEFEQDEYFDWIPPEGFTYIGEGSDRIVFVSDETGVIYKRQLDYNSANSIEWDNLQRLKEIPIEGWELPEAYLFHVSEEPIMAMEFVDGRSDGDCMRTWDHDGLCTCNQTVCIALIWELPRQKWGIFDLHEDNMIVRNDGIRVLIDICG